MKKSIILVLLLVTGFTAFAQLQTSPQWTRVLSDQPETFRTQLVSSSENSIKVNVQVPGFYTTNVTTPRGEAKIISMPKAVSTAQAGEPNVPMTGIPAIIGDRARMNIRVLDAQYMDFEGIEVAPSKGDFPRTIDPATVPYTYGECYNQDAFFPASNVGLYEPYIVRDFRGQNMVVYPYAYNPVTKTLRVYYNMTVEMYKVDDHGTNVMETRRSNVVKMDQDFKSLYQRHFINYEAAMNRYTPVDEEGDLLIICYDDFISSMTNFVNWKKTRGVNTSIVGTSTAGSTYSAIKTYITNQYNANNDLTHVLLVGDVAQIPGYPFTNSYKGDNPYGQVAGDDNYNDVFIGRFSASSAAQVTTQVNRTITYERDLTTSASWCQNGLGISASAGNGGHYNEDDYQHVENLRTDLLSYGYNTVHQDYYNVSGYPSSSTTTISNHINSGVGIINYCNHGQETGWQSHSPYYTNTYVNALANDNKLPFIFSVACLVGKYDYSSGDCFAETWMHATNNSNPTGAIGGAFSYISQPWIPPMWAQDEFVDILVESYSNNIKRTLGGAAINGMLSIFDHYSSTSGDGYNTYQAWVVYGDPTLMLRTKTPQAMTVTHSGSLPLGSSTYSVNVSNGNGAVATITDADHNILGKATVSNGSATISISGNLTPNQELTLCVFGYNKVTYLGTITVTGGTQYTITVTQPQHGTISAPSQAYAGATVTLTATPETGYCLSSWIVKKGNTNITVTNNQFTMPESNVTVTATFVQGLAITLAPVTHGSISADPMYALQGTTINLTATPATGYLFNSWVVYKTGDATTTVTVSGNSFTMPSYPVTVCAVFLAPAGGDVTVGSGTNTSQYIPTYNYYDYSLTQQIYTQAEVGEAGTITHIAFYVSANPSSRKIDIYMSHTSKSSFSSTSDWVSQSTSYRVVKDYQAFGQSGWNVIPLETPFEYNGTSNLLVTVDDNTNSWSSSKISFYVYSTGANRAHYTYQDDTDFNPASISANSSYNKLMTSNNQVKFTKEVPSTEGYLSVSPTSLTGFNTVAGTASSAQNVAVIGANLQANLTVTAPNGYEVSSSQNGTYNGTLTLTPTSGSIRANVYVRLKANASAGNYNGNMTLASGSTTASVSLSGSVSQGSGTQYAITATANPTAGGTITGAGTYYENGTCTLVATANTGYTFTNWTKNGSVVSTNATYSFTVSGNATYVANFTLNSYEVTATANPATGGTISGTGSYDHGTTATLTATANEGYTFTNWTKSGVSVSTNTAYSFTVTEATTLVANFTINSYNVMATANPAEGGTVTVGARNRDELVYDFEDGTTQGWTILQGSSSTSSHNWMHVNDYVRPSYATSSYGHGSSDGWMLSESYISTSSSGGGTAVTPDNYLISPQIRLGGSINFWVTNGNDTYGAEHFAVLVSTNGNTSTSDFTQLQEWTLSSKATRTGGTRTFTDGTWYEYTVDLSAYSGMGYVAIRHFDCYDQWFMGLDDITIVEGVDQSTGSGNFNYGETCVVTATPLGDYHFVNWTENGNVVSTSASYTFTVTADRDLVANFALTTTQTVNLVQGWNWWTPTVEVSLGELEAGLGTHGIIIKTQTENVTYEDDEWMGDEITLTPGQMYKIKVDADCSFTLSGIPASGVTVTINPGSNWFGYTGLQAMSIADALNGFTPAEGDVIKTGTANTTFEEGEWMGDFDNLQPGQGYIYVSRDTVQKTITFLGN